MVKPAYTYRAVVKSVYDADTVTLDIDLGLNTWMRNQKIRLYGINAPEVRGEQRPAGLAARDYLRERIDGTKIVVATHKDSKGKYGRWLGVIHVDGIDINRELVEMGHAIWRKY